MKQQGWVIGHVEYRAGDGAKATIRRGAVEVETTPNDATLSWHDGETHGNAAIPITDFRRYVSNGDLRLG